MTSYWLDNFTTFREFFKSVKVKKTQKALDIFLTFKNYLLLVRQFYNFSRIFLRVLK